MIKLTDQEQKLIEQMRGPLGDAFAKYLERVLDDYCDIRNLSPNEDIQAVQRLATAIERDVITKLRVGTIESGNGPVSYE